MCVFDDVPQVMKLSGKTEMEADRQNVVFHSFPAADEAGSPLSVSCVSLGLQWQ